MFDRGREITSMNVKIKTKILGGAVNSQLA
jgi:hypothetical protein